jgi:hypothetical protein
VAAIKITDNTMILAYNYEKTWRLLGLQKITKNPTFIKNNEVTPLLDQRTDSIAVKSKILTQVATYMKKYEKCREVE